LEFAIFTFFPFKYIEKMNQNNSNLAHPLQQRSPNLSNKWATLNILNTC